MLKFINDRSRLSKFWRKHPEEIALKAKIEKESNRSVKLLKFCNLSILPHILGKFSVQLRSILHLIPPKHRSVAQE